MNKNSIYLLLMAAALWAACSSEPKQGKESTGQPDSSQAAPVSNAPVFNADSAYYFVKKQVDFGPRNPNSMGHRACAAFLEDELRKYAAEVIVQKASLKAFDGTMLDASNIIASFNPKAARRVMLCAHWDTRPFADKDTANVNKPILGANDGGSGVGILLEIARLMANHPPAIGVDIILFDAEDYGQPDNSPLPRVDDSYCLGSQYWARNKHKSDYKADYGILLDMVGAANARFVWEETSVSFAEPVLGKVWGAANQLGYGSYFNYYKKSGLIDDHLYINRLAGIPTIDIIEYDMASPSGTFSKSWHTHADDMSVIDKNTLKAVGQTLLEVVFREK